MTIPLISRWQARKEGDKNMRAGLIPSKLLQERRIVLERANEGKGIIHTTSSYSLAGAGLLSF